VKGCVEVSVCKFVLFFILRAIDLKKRALKSPYRDASSLILRIAVVGLHWVSGSER